MKRPLDLMSKLKASNPELKNYVLELEKENLKLHKQIAKLQVKDISQQNQITALKKAQPKRIVRFVDFSKAVGVDKSKK